jgi:hypothetical protein
MVNGGRSFSHQAPTASHRFFAPSAQNIGSRPISNPAFKKTPEPQTETGNAPPGSSLPEFASDCDTNYYYKIVYGA